MKPREIVAMFGSETKAAVALGVAVTTVRLWLKKKKVPRMTQHAIAHITNDALKVDEK